MRCAGTTQVQRSSVHRILSLDVLTTREHARALAWVRKEVEKFDPNFAHAKNVELICSDFDLTLGNSAVAFPLLDDEQHPIIYPESFSENVRGTPVILGFGPERDAWLDLERLKISTDSEEFPSLFAEGLQIDKSELLNREAIANTEPIAVHANEVRRRTKASPETVRHFVITGRTDVDEQVPLGTHAFAKANDVKTYGVFGVGDRGELCQILSGRLNVGQRKAIVAELLMELYGADRNNVRQLGFVDNDPKYMEPFIECITRWQPDIDMSFWSVIHKGIAPDGHNTFRHFPIGRFVCPSGSEVRQLIHMYGQGIIDLEERMKDCASRNAPF